MEIVNFESGNPQIGPSPSAFVVEEGLLLVYTGPGDKRMLLLLF